MADRRPTSEVVPKSLCCPITLELMHDPVHIAGRPHTSFERAALMEWWDYCEAQGVPFTCPITKFVASNRQPAARPAVEDSVQLRSVCEEWVLEKSLRGKAGIDAQSHEGASQSEGDRDSTNTGHFPQSSAVAAAAQTACDLDRLANLVGLLASPDATKQTEAGNALETMLGDAQTMKVVLRVPLFCEQLVDLLGSVKDAPGQEAVLKSLVVLATDEDGKKVLQALPSFESELLNKLAALLGSPSVGVQEHSARALKLLTLVSTEMWKVASYDLFLLRSCNPEFVRKLVGLLGSTNGRVQEEAAGVLANLATAPPQSFSTFYADGPLKRLERLVHLLKSPHMGVQKEAARALRALGRDNQVSLRIVRSPGLCLERLVSLLGSTSADVQEQAAAVMVNILMSADGVQMGGTIGRVRGCPQRLVDLLVSQSAEVQRLAAVALSRLASVAANETALCGVPGRFERLVSLLRSPCAGTQEAAAKALGYLAGGIHAERILMVPDCLESLVGLLGSTSPGVQEQGAEVLGRLSGVANCRRKIADVPNCLEKVVALLGSNEENVRKQATAVLRSLALDRENKTTIGQLPGCLDALAGLLREDSPPGVQEQAAGALRILAADHAENRTAILRVWGCAQKLELLRRTSRDLGVQVQAAGALHILDPESDVNHYALPFGLRLSCCGLLELVLSSRQV